MLFLSSLIDLPSIENILAGVGTTSAPLVTQLYPIALFFVGFTVAGFVIVFMWNVIVGLFKSLASLASGDRGMWDDWNKWRREGFRKNSFHSFYDDPE